MISSKPITFAFYKLRLRTTLLVPFVLQIIAAVSLVGFFSYINEQQAIEELANHLMNEAGNRVSLYLEDYLKIPPLLNRLNAKAVRSGELDINSQLQSGRYLTGQNQEFPWIYRLQRINAVGDTVSSGVFGESFNSKPSFWGLLVADGNDKSIYRIYKTDSEGKPTQLVNTSKNPPAKERLPYKTAVATKKAAWTPIYPSVVAKELLIAAVLPLYDRSTGKLQAVLGSVIGLNFTQFLETIKISPRANIYLVEPNGSLVIDSTRESVFKESNNPKNTDLQRLTMFDSPSPILRAAGDRLRQQVGDLSKLQGSKQLKFKVQGEPYFLTAIPFQDKLGLQLTIIVTIPESDFLAQIHQNAQRTALLCLLATLVAIAMGILSARTITNPIIKLTQASKELADGNLDRRVDTVDVIEIEEIETLEQSFNNMAAQLQEAFETLEDKVKERTSELVQANDEIITLNEKLKAENLRMGAELDVARQIQMMILPKPEELENIEGLDIAGYMEPADEVGGDYYDVLHTDGVVTMGMGDVTGHGLESGILMLMTQTAVRTLQEIREADPVVFLDTLNRTLYKNVQRMNSDKSLTLVILNYFDGKISISGQHEETLIVRKGGEIERIDTMDLGFPIGLDEEIADFISHTTIDLQPGDGVVLYTDGIPEAKDMDKKQYGIEPLCAAISDNWHKSAGEVKDAAIADLRRHIGKQKVFDDITLLVLKRTELGVEKELQPQAVALV